MLSDELSRRIKALRSRPLLVLARTPSGKERVMDIQECADTGSAYLHVVADELDALLSQALGGPPQSRR